MLNEILNMNIDLIRPVWSAFMPKENFVPVFGE